MSENAKLELKQIIELKNKLDFYNDFDEIYNLIIKVLEFNPHSIHTLNKH